MFPFVALFSWPVVSLAFFKRYSVSLAILLTIIAGYLVLPEKTEIDLPLLPALNKFTIPAIAALLIVLFSGTARQSPDNTLPGWLPKSWIAILCLSFLVVGAFFTVLQNGDALYYGPTTLPGLRPYDAMSAILGVIMSILPMLLARKYLATTKGHRMVLVAFCGAALIYSVPILVELRMSPQVHNWVYGFFPHVWGQHARGGGWRPVVFLGHGLLLGIFLSGAVLSAFGLARSAGAHKTRYLAAGVWLLLVLAVSKNLGALIITLLLLPVIVFWGVRLRLLVAGIIAGLFLAYPVVRDTPVVPLDRIVALANDINPARALSLSVRLKNEDNFLAKTYERPVFGWGGWGRSRMYSDETGLDVTIADGAWIITLSVFGWIGYLGRFGLLCAPLLLLMIARRRVNVGPETAVLAVILAGNLVDLIPNSSVSPLTWIVAGALWGRLELGSNDPGGSDAVAQQVETADVPAQPANPYTRQTAYIKHMRTKRK